MLITEKRYCIETLDGVLLEPYIREFFTSDSQTLFTWPSAILLASYIASSNVTNGLSTLELGAGCGLPSIIAALVGKGTRCVLTERPDDRILQNLTFNIVGNGLNDLCQVVSC
jgi:predicted nicotinamide N-methyase